MLDFAVIRDLLQRHGDALDRRVRSFDIGGRPFDFDRQRYLTGVINLSPDSWYEESVATTTEAALARAERLAADGAHLIDIGAESTLPHAERADVARQLDRLLPVVRGCIERGLLVSVESYYPEVLETCAQAGAQVFNLTGMREAGEVFEIAARHQAAVILCYVQGAHVREVGDFELKEDMVPELLAYFRALTERAEEKGVTRCFIDPGLGFYYKNLLDSTTRISYQMNTFLTCFRLAELGWPTFNILPHAPEIFREDERRAAEPFFSVLALLGRTHMIRSHEIRTVARVREAMGL